MADEAKEGSIATSAPKSQWELIRSIVVQYDKQVYGFLLGAAYVVGFVTLNTHLGKIGIYDFEFASTRIVLAFATCLFYLICFYLFAGRAALFGKKWMAVQIERLMSVRANPKWALLPFFGSYVKSLFFCCFSAAIFSSLVIDNASALLFYGAASLAFLIFYPLDVLNWDLRYPRILISAEVVFDVVAIVAFFVQPDNEIALRVFWVYLAIFCFVNMVLDQFERRVKTRDMISFVMLYGSIFCITIAAGFGSMFYGLIPSRYGGGKATPVELVLSDSFLKSLPADQAAQLKPPIKASLVFQASDSYYVEANKKIFKVRASDVPVIYFLPSPESNFFERMVKQFRGDAKTP